jgi:hypothetical protein
MLPLAQRAKPAPSLRAARARRATSRLSHRRHDPREAKAGLTQGGQPVHGVRVAGKSWAKPAETRAAKERERPAVCGPSLIAGAGFEPATFGL